MITVIGRSLAVCERCIISCTAVYEDAAGARTRKVLCPNCGNGDPQQVMSDCGLTREQLDANLRFLEFVKGGPIDITWLNR